MNSHNPLRTKTKKLNNPDPRTGHWGRAIRSLFRLIGFAFLFTLLLTLFYLLTLGVPDPLTRRITANLQKKGVPLCVESISLSPHRGWVLHNACLYSRSPDDIEPILQADKLYLQTWPEHWVKPVQPDWNFSLYSRQVNLSFGPPWETSLSNKNSIRILHKVRGHLHIDRTGFTLSDAELHWGDFIIRASGKAISAHKPSSPSAPISLAAQTRITQIANFLAGLTFKTPPEINIQFHIPASGVDQTTLDASFSAGGLQRQKQRFDQINGALHLHNRQLTLNTLQFTQHNGEHLNAFGLLDLKTRTARLTLDNTLSADALLALFPDSAKIQLTRAGIVPFGSADFDAVLGPSAPEQLFKTVHANIHKLQVKRQDLTFDPLSLTLTRNGDRVVLSTIQAQANGTPLIGTFEINLASRAWKTSLQGAARPDPIGTLTGGGFQKFIQRFSFPGPPPSIQVNLSHSGKKGSFRVEGTLSGTDFLYTGIPLDSMETSIAYSNRVLVLNGLHAAQGKKRFDGDIQIDFQHKLADFNVISSFDPLSIAQVIAPQHPTILTNFTFTDPLELKGSGQIDYSGGTNHAFSGTFTGDKVSIGKLTLNKFSSRIKGRGNQLIFSNASMKLFSGDVGGSAVFDLQFKDQDAPYSMNIHAKQINLQQLLKTFSTYDSSRTTGLLSGTFRFNADANRSFWNSASGAGKVKIEKGQLHDFPLLGGFSRLIRTTLPGFSLFSLTTLYSEYELRDGALTSDNLQLGGTFFSVRAHGQYSPEKGLNFIAQTEPLRQTRENKEWYQLQLWGADVIKQGTAPLFRLLKFKLTGSLNAPDWRLVNLPDEFSDLLKSPKSMSYGPWREKIKKPSK